MKKILLIILFVLFLLSPMNAFAHSGGASTIRINNKPTNAYTSEEYVNIGEEAIPSDIAPDKYLINKSIVFEVDTSKLPVSEEVLEQTTYVWDFGDGKKAKGEKVKHVYAKAKSYVVNLEINYGIEEEASYSNNEMGQEPQPQQQFQTLLIHILPNLDYRVPSVKFVIDGKAIDNPLRDRPRFDFFQKILFFNFPRAITYDATKSTGTGKIVSYFWDFGDGEINRKAKVRHRFKDKFYFYTVGLKVTDENGFSAYSVASLADNKAFEGN